MFIELMPQGILVSLSLASMEGICLQVTRDIQNQLRGISTANLIISYPLKNEVIKEVNLKEVERYGVVNYLVQEIIDTYKNIYKEEEEELKKNPQGEGIYGIWGHSLRDLVLHRITLDTDKKEITLGIDS